MNAGHRITAIGGSDNHDAGLSSDVASSIGRPTTLVHAQELSTKGLLAGLRAGRVFIDFDGSRDRLLDLSARTARSTATMGGTLAARRGETVIFTATVAGADQARLEIVQDGEKRAPVFTRPGGFSIRMGDRPSWVRVNLRDTDGWLLALGNPVYLSPAP